MEAEKTALESPEKTISERRGDRLLHKNTREKNKSILRRFIPVPLEIVRSEAIKKLDGTAFRVLLGFIQKRASPKVGKEKQSRSVYEKGGLAFTYTEAASMGIESHAFYHAIKLLIEIGFIDEEHQGGTCGNDPSQYTISERWRDYGTANSKEVEKKWIRFNVSVTSEGGQ